MAELPALVKDLALILIVAGTVTLIFKKLRQPLVLGYIVAGFLVSPRMPYIMSVVDSADVRPGPTLVSSFFYSRSGLIFPSRRYLKWVPLP